MCGITHGLSYILGARNVRHGMRTADQQSTEDALFVTPVGINIAKEEISFQVCESKVH